jgi:hypothetical protein
MWVAEFRFWLMGSVLGLWGAGRFSLSGPRRIGKDGIRVGWKGNMLTRI